MKKIASQLVYISTACLKSESKYKIYFILNFKIKINNALYSAKEHCPSTKSKVIFTHRKQLCSEQ